MIYFHYNAFTLHCRVAPCVVPWREFHRVVSCLKWIFHDHVSRPLHFLKALDRNFAGDSTLTTFFGDRAEDGLLTKWFTGYGL